MVKSELETPNQPLHTGHATEGFFELAPRLLRERTMLFCCVFVANKRGN